MLVLQTAVFKDIRFLRISVWACPFGSPLRPPSTSGRANFCPSLVIGKGGGIFTHAEWTSIECWEIGTTVAHSNDPRFHQQQSHRRPLYERRRTLRRQPKGMTAMLAVTSSDRSSPAGRALRSAGDSRTSKAGLRATLLRHKQTSCAYRNATYRPAKTRAAPSAAYPEGTSLKTITASRLATAGSPRVETLTVEAFTYLRA
jgi:hypothetical protein